MDIASTVKLNNGVQMPWLGFGVFQLKAGKETEQSVRWALEIGYRHIDTAAAYGNEADVGRAIRASGIPRESIFVTTKVWNADQGYESALKAFDKSRRALDMDAVDLYLIHWPVKGKSSDTWRALEKLLADGRVRAIGVSNFLAHHLKEILSSSSIVPAVNQVEFHPFLVQEDLLAFDARAGIQHEAWSPLLRGRNLDNPVLVEIAGKHGRTAAQVILRWDIQKGVVTIPRSTNRDRILENSRIFDFTLDAAEMRSISGLENGTRVGPHPDNVNF